ncbi:MAG TPA: TonB-dependent receptor, partial [bacterium]|nr:TonB-dependent receptor [bacterium]
YLDGIKIPTLNHFSTQGASGGAVGIINADLIQNVNYYSGAFPANRSNALSGVFEFKLKDGNKESTNRRVSVGASEAAFTLDGPISDNTTYLLSLRRSYLQFLFDAIGLPFLPTFNDVLFKSKTDLNQKNQITLIGLGALDQSRLNTGLDDPDAEQQYILNYLPEQDQWNYMIGGNFKHISGKSFQNYIFSRNVLNNESYKYFNNQKDPENKILDYQSKEVENRFRFNNTYRNKGYKVVLGAQVEQANYFNETYQKRFVGNQTEIVDYDTDLTLYKWGLSGQVSKAYLRDKLRLSLGVRSDANNYSSSMNNLIDQFSPRFSASYSLTKTLNLNFNTGLYHELPPYTSLGFRNSAGELANKENNIKYISVSHIIGGIEFFRNSDSKISLEGFYKQYSDYPLSLDDSISLANKGADFAVIGDEEIISKGEGRAYGLELSGRYVLFEDMESIVSYTLVKSEFDDLSGDYIPSSWDSRHIFTMTTSKPFMKNWQAGYRFRYVSGLPYTPYDLDKSASITAWNTRGQPFLDFSAYNSKRLEDFMQLDIRVDRRFYFSNFALTLYLDVQNAFNYQAEQPDILIPETDESGNRIIANPEAPEAEQKYVLNRIDNTTGTVLPTIGIILDF